MKAVKCTWVASMPRSGSMWAFNVTRELFRAAGYRVFPETIPRAAAEMIALADRALADEASDTAWVLKTHDGSQSEVPESRFISTHRDIRDALISFMNFVQCDFGFALKAMISAADVSDRYRSLPKDIVLNIDYRDITGNPMDVARQIARFCAIDAEDGVLNDIVAQFDKPNVGRLIAETENDVIRRLQDRAEIDSNEIVPLANGQTRVMHLATGFQGGHVTGYRDGDWRVILDAEQQRMLQETFGDWLARNGYD